MSPTPPILGGIHVSGGDYCPQRAKPSNVGTIISQPGLVAAMQAFPGSALNPKIAADMTIFVDEGSVTSEQTGTVLAPFQQLGAALKAAEGKKGAALITVAPGTYADLATTVKPRFDIRIVLPAGDAIFYPNLHYASGPARRTRMQSSTVTIIGSANAAGAVDCTVNVIPPRSRTGLVPAAFALWLRRGTPRVRTACNTARFPRGRS